MNVINCRLLLALSIICGMLVTDSRSYQHQKPSLEPFRIGVFLDLSGITSSFGRSMLNGVELAAGEINNHQVAEGRRVELIIEDDSGRPAEAATVVQRQGVTGRITMDENRNASRAVIVRLRDGKYYFCEDALPPRSIGQ